MNVQSAQALRNRHLFVVDQLRKAVQEAIARDGEARILSLACGSAQSVFEAVHEVQPVRILALDVNPTAITYSRPLAQVYGITAEWFAHGKDSRLSNVISTMITYTFASSAPSASGQHTIVSAARSFSSIQTPILDSLGDMRHSD